MGSWNGIILRFEPKEKTNLKVLEQYLNCQGTPDKYGIIEEVGLINTRWDEISNTYNTCYQGREFGITSLKRDILLAHALFPECRIEGVCEKGNNTVDWFYREEYLIKDGAKKMNAGTSEVCYGDGDDEPNVEKWTEDAVTYDSAAADALMKKASEMGLDELVEHIQKVIK